MIFGQDPMKKKDCTVEIHLIDSGSHLENWFVLFILKPIRDAVSMRLY